jgi:hypothetical protein
VRECCVFVGCVCSVFECVEWGMCVLYCSMQCCIVLYCVTLNIVILYYIALN